MTTRYKNVQIYVDPKDHKELKKKLARKTTKFPKGQSLSSWVREKTKEFLSDKK
jgi:hypothetical protein